MKPVRPMVLFIAFLAAAAFLSSVAFLGLVLGFIRQDLTAFGLKTGPYPLSGLTRAEAAAQFEKHAASKLHAAAIIADFNGQTFQASPADIGLAPDTEAATETAFAVGRGDMVLKQAMDITLCALHGRDIPLEVQLDEKKLAAWLDGLAAKIDADPRDARLSFNGGNISVQPAVTGRKLDTAALAEELKPNLLALDLPQKVTLAPVEQPPKVRDEDLLPIDGVLASYSTWYDPLSNRGRNIEIATAALDGTLVRSGTELSFNGTVGGRVAGSGYQTAPVIINGKVEQDIGGGVCQVSSTLYNAILLADLTPTQRTAHFFPSAYVPPGLDATVADGQIDFCFRNSLPHAVYLQASAGDGTLTFTVWGHLADVPEDIELETKVKDPRPIVDVWRVYYRNDNEVDREFLHTDEYDIPKEDEDTAARETAPAPSASEDPDPEPEPEPPAPEPAAPENPAPVVSAPTPPTPPTAPTPAPAPAAPAKPAPASPTGRSNPSPQP